MERARVRFGRALAQSGEALARGTAAPDFAIAPKRRSGFIRATGPTWSGRCS